MPTANKDAITLLKQDHTNVRKLLSDLDEAEGAEARRSLIEEIEQEVRFHSTVEEEIFYPAYKEAVSTKDERKLFFEAAEEHHLIDIVLEEISEEGPSSELFAAKGKVLKDLIEHHADEEEKEMFPTARKHMGADQLEELGAQILEMKDALQREESTMRR